MIDTTGELITSISTMAILRTEDLPLRGGRCREVLTRVNEQKMCPLGQKKNGL